MFNHEIKFITDISLNETRALGAFISFDELLKSNLHPAILKYISAEIDLMIFEDRKKLLDNSEFDYTGEEIKAQFEQINHEIKKRKKFSANQIDKMIYNAIAFNFSYLIHPKKALLKFIFNDEWVRTTEEVLQLLNFIYYYDFIKKFCEKYFYKKAFLSVDKDEFTTIVEKLDKEIFGSYSKAVMDSVLNSMSDFFNIGTINKHKIPLIAVEQFIIEKKLASYIERFQNAFPRNSKMLYPLDDLKQILYKPLTKDVDHSEEYLREKISDTAVNINVEFKSPQISAENENIPDEDQSKKKLKNDLSSENIIDDEDLNKSKEIGEELPALKAEEDIQRKQLIIERNRKALEDERKRKEEIKLKDEYEKELNAAKKEEDQNLPVENLVENKIEDDQVKKSEEKNIEEKKTDEVSEVKNDEKDIAKDSGNKPVEIEWRSNDDDDFLIVGEEESTVGSENIELDDDNDLLIHDNSFEINDQEDEITKQKQQAQTSTSEGDVNKIDKSEVSEDSSKETLIEQKDEDNEFDKTDLLNQENEINGVDLDREPEKVFPEDEYNLSENTNSDENETLSNVETEFDELNKFDEENSHPEVTEDEILSTHFDDDELEENIPQKDESDLNEIKDEIYFEDENLLEDNENPNSKIEEKHEVETSQEFEQDIFSFFSDKDLQVVLDGVFQGDAEDFALTIDTLSTPESLDEAMEVLRALFKSYRVRSSSKEAQILIKVVNDYYNQKE